MTYHTSIHYQNYPTFEQNQKLLIMFGSKSVVTILFFIFSIQAFTQTPQWEWVVQGGGDKSDEARWLHYRQGYIYVEGQFYKTTTIGDVTLDGEGTWSVFFAFMDKNGNWKDVASQGTVRSNLKVIEPGESNQYFYGIQDFATEVEYDSKIYKTNGEYDFIVIKRGVADAEEIWVNKAGGSERDVAYGLVVDKQGNCYITGYFRKTAYFGPYSVTSKGGGDVFIAKLDKTGNWAWVTSAGGSNNDGGQSIALDNDGNIYITGFIRKSAQFGSESLSVEGNSAYTDMFVAKADNNGNWLWAKNVGGMGDDTGKGIVLDNEGNIFVTGSFVLDVDFGSQTVESAGELDVYVAKADSDGNWLWSISAGGESYDVAEAITLDDEGAIYIAGYFKKKSFFGESHSLFVDGERDFFVAKIIEK